MKKVFCSNNMKKIFPFLLIVILSCSYFFLEYSNSDELWNYNFVKNFVNGKLPYRDFNMVQTPLFIIFPAIFMKIFACQLIVFRIVGVILQFFIFSLFYILINKTTRIKSFSLIITILLQSYDVIFYVYNYNYLNLFIILLIFLCIEYYDKYPKIMNIIIPLLFGITPLIKQNVGAILMISYVIILVVNKIIRKTKIKFIIQQIGIMCIPMVIFIIWLYWTGIFYYFWDYCVYGIFTFTSRFTLIDALKIMPFVDITASLIILIIAYYFIFIFRNGFNLYNFTFFIISIASFFVAYPLCDGCHYFISIIPFVVFTFKILKLSKCNNITKSVFNLVSIVMVILVVSLNISSALKCKFTNYKNLKYIPIETSMIKQINCIDNFIVLNNKKGISVYIADSSSVGYTLPMDIYRKNWDMLLIGNVGSTTVDELLQVEENSYILIYPKLKYVPSSQEYRELIERVKTNYKKCDEVGGFYVYKKY